MSEAHDTARGFAAFPARKGGRLRGQSWWGRTWTEAVEDTSLSTEALKAGRAYARSGRLGPITVSPGRIAAHAYDGDTSFTTAVTFVELTEAEWERLWGQVTEHPAVLAELLSDEPGDLPPDLLEAAEDARVRLLPGYGDLEADCGCEEFEDPCSHAAALCYQVSWLLDQEPSLLLLVRGRDLREAREELKSAVLLQAMTGATDEEDAAPAPLPDGTAAHDAYAGPLAPLPPLPPLPGPSARRSGPASGLAADPLAPLVAGAAARARELLAHLHGFRPEPPAPWDARQDAVRIGATHPDPRAAARLREASASPEHFDRAVRAWQYGGPCGLDTLETPWTPPHQDLARARTTLAADWTEDELPPLETTDNRVTLTGRGLQLRYGRDARWYPYRLENDTWWPSAGPHPDPADALAALLDA
ncbi:SWIM zinc finger family protein [Streptomyces sp. NPDC087440]|uniref:SWIM zinc finger family protein n=1 Tax=Streptomyces sp. NPDC087440 TaxID=3365790 RepID=UPI00380B31DB